MTAVFKKSSVGLLLLQAGWLMLVGGILLTGFFVPVGPETRYSWVVGLLVAACFLLSAWHILNNLHHHSAQQKKQWAYVAILFLVFALDKLLGFHEWLKKPLQDLLGLSYDFSSIWFLPLLLLSPLWLMPVYKLYIAQDFTFQRSFRLAVVVYGLGAVGIDLLQSFYASTFGKEGTGLHALHFSEEVLEASGALLFHHLFRKGVPENKGG